MTLTAAALGTAVLHATVVYGRGHYNVQLGHSIVVDPASSIVRPLATAERALLYQRAYRLGPLAI